MATIAVLGSTNADLVVPLERRPGPGETVLAGDTETSPGGKGANCAVAAARLGGDVVLLSAVGTDPYGAMLRGSLERAGVDVTLLEHHDGPSGAAYITVTPDGENSIVVSPGANRAVTADYVRRVATPISGARVLVASLEIPAEPVWQAITFAARSGVRCVLNASPVIGIPAGTLSLLDPLLVNEHEAAWLLGGTEADPAAALVRLGAPSAVVTLGARGAAIADAGGSRTVGAPAVETVDSTGAGDAFAGALAVRLARGDTLDAAAGHAARYAADSVTRKGAQSSYCAAAKETAS